jgi:hypothetical protein
MRRWLAAVELMDVNVPVWHIFSGSIDGRFGVHFRGAKKATQMSGRTH